jgi:type I restriction enzyme S subunit
MVHMPQLFANDIIDDQDMPKVLLKKNEKEKYLLKEGDIIFGRRSLTIEGSGKCSLVGKPSTPLTFESSIIRISPDKRKLYPKYAYFYLASPHGRYQMFTITRIVAVSGVAGSDLKLYELPLPPLPEQKKIAEILSAWDRAIEQVGKLIDAKQRLKKGLMQQLLTGRMRFPEFGAPVKEKGKLPEGWEKVRLQSLCKKQKGRKVVINNNNNNNGDGIPYIGATSFDGNYSKFTKDTNGVLCQPSDILLLWDGEYAGKTSTGHYGIISSTVAVLKVNTHKGTPIFLHYVFILKNQQVRSIREGSGIPHIPGDFLHWFKISIPSLQEQARIAAILSTCDREIELLKKKQEKLKEQKKGLMQKLLTGEVRVKVNKVCSLK